VFSYSRSIAQISLYFKKSPIDLEDRAIRLPNLKNNRKLPLVFSQEELRRLFKVPQRLKQRVLLCLIYSAGLRVSEVCKLKISDMDFDRMQIHVRLSKNNKSRYVVLSHYIAQGLKQYIKGLNLKSTCLMAESKVLRSGTVPYSNPFDWPCEKQAYKRKLVCTPYGIHLLPICWSRA